MQTLEYNIRVKWMFVLNKKSLKIQKGVNRIRKITFTQQQYTVNEKGQNNTDRQ